MSTPGVAVLRLVEEHRRKAEVVAEFNPQEAEIIRGIAEAYESAVRESMPEWWSLPAVQQAKAWSLRSLRRRCRDLARSGRARKGANGRWEMRWDAVLELPDPPARFDDIEVGEDLDALADQLASED